MVTERLRHERAYRGELLGKIAAFPLLICGVGAIGSNLAVSLVRQGFSNVTILDADRVEAHNLGTQYYGLQHVGMEKVQALEHVVWDESEVGVVGLKYRLDQSNINKLKVKRYRCVIDAFDNAESRGLLKRVCEQQEVPCLHGGVNADFAEVRWNEHYIVPSGEGEDVCEYPLARNLITLTVAVMAESLISFIESGVKRDFTITLRDLRIAEVR